MWGARAWTSTFPKAAKLLSVPPTRRLRLWHPFHYRTTRRITLRLRWADWLNPYMGIDHYSLLVVTPGT